MENFPNEFNIIAQQGEVPIYRVAAIPEGVETRIVHPGEDGEYIISHSEQGNNHVLTGGDVMEVTKGGPEGGMRLLYAILKEPQEFVHKAAGAHAPIKMEAGIYMFRVSQEYDPFADQVRQVQD